MSQPIHVPRVWEVTGKPPADARAAAREWDAAHRRRSNVVTLAANASAAATQLASRSRRKPLRNLAREKRGAVSQSLRSLSEDTRSL